MRYKILDTSGEQDAGFTLIEMIVAIFGFTIIMGGLLALFSGIFTNSNSQLGLLSDTDQARRLAFGIAGELRDAQTGQNGAAAVDTAATSTIIFYSNADNDTSIERVRYFTKTGQLWKGVTQYNGATYNTSTEQTYLVQSDLANSAATPVFYYYDGNYIGSSTQSSLAQPVSPAQVKFVKVNIQIFNKAGAKKTNTYTVTAGANIRNLKTNISQ